MRFMFTALLFLLFYGVRGQEKDVDIQYRKSNGQVILHAKNNKKHDLEITVSLEVKNLKGYKEPITLLVKSDSTKDIIKLNTIPGKAWTYNYTYSYKIVYPGGISGEVSRKLNISRDEVESSIIVFDKDGCTRCDYTIEFLESRKIPHFVLNISKDEESSELMIQYLSSAGYTASKVNTPVMIVSGKPHYNIQNLQSFVQGLRKYKKKKK